MSRCYSRIMVFGWLWVGVFSSSAAIFGDFEYEILGNNTVEVTGYYGLDEELVIPDSIDGLPVVSIGDWAFSWSDSLTVTIPDSVTSIGYRAFFRCGRLTAINVGELNPAFSSVDGVLFDKKQTTVIQCPGGYQGDFEIPTSVTSIGDYAFSDCDSLTSVTIGDRVTSIGWGAFSGYRAFFRCGRLTAINVGELNPAFSSVDGVLYDKNQTTVLQCPGGYQGDFEIPTSVTSIGDYAFYGCESLTSVTIGDSVTSIGWVAFSGCSGLTSVTIPDSVTSIGGYAFQYCINLTAINVGELNPSYSSVDGVLYDKNQTTVIQCPGGYQGDFEIPASVTSIGDDAFYGCESLTSVTIGDSVTSIGDDAFSGCSGLTSVTIPDSVTSIGEWAFSGCSGLTSVTIGDGVTSIGKRAFSGCSGLTSVTVPDSVTSIGFMAFSGCSGLTSVTIGDGVTSIDRAFDECVGLSEVYFKGDAPSADYFVFDGSEPTIYYIEGTDGWGDTFAGRPTAVWYLDEPELFLEQMTFDSAGVHFSVVGPAGRTVLVQACTGLAAGEWQDLGTFSLDENGTYAFTDPGWADFPSRFYRAAFAEGSGPILEGMALIPAVSFLMGDSFGGEGYEGELPRHSVNVSGFFMDRVEVTKQLWDEVRAWGNDHGYDLIAGGGKGPGHPVHSVNWYDVVKWCNARSEKEGLTPCYYTSDTKGTVYRTGEINLSNDSVRWEANGYRLPTEAEWEKAARGGLEGKRFPWGDTISHSQANYYSNPYYYSYDVSPTRGFHPDYDSGDYPYTSPAGSFAPNGYGLYDMAGNLWEWCWDWWDEGWYGQSGANEQDPIGPDGGSDRVLRGGGWYYDSSILVRCALRRGYTPDDRYYDYGFRCARGQS